MSERRPWDRRPNETAKAYEAFRAFRDRGPTRSLRIGDAKPTATHREWASKHDWTMRAIAWDDEVHMAADAQRLESIRSMHEIHSRAGRAAINLALGALARVQPDTITASEAARLLELGARLERDTLVHSVEELQGVLPPAAESMGPPAAEDPWERIARELAGPA